MGGYADVAYILHIPLQGACSCYVLQSACGYLHASLRTNVEHLHRIQPKPMQYNLSNIFSKAPGLTLVLHTALNGKLLLSSVDKHRSW